MSAHGRLCCKTGIDAAGSQNRDRPSQHRRGMRNRQILGRRCWTSAWAPNGRRHASELGRRVDTQSNQKPGRALLALVERRRADLSSRGRLPRSLPPVRHGLALIRRLLSQRPASRLHIRKFSLRPLLGLAPETPWSFKFQAWRPPGMQCIAAKFVCILRWRLSGSPTRRSYRNPYGPEHAYTSRRVSTIETTRDPATPIPLEKNTNICRPTRRDRDRSEWVKLSKPRQLNRPLNCRALNLRSAVGPR